MNQGQLLIAQLSPEFADALSAAVNDPRPGLILVSAAVMDFGLVAARGYLGHLCEQLRAKGADVEQVEPARREASDVAFAGETVDGRPGRVIFAGEFRCTEDVLRACAYANAGSTFVAAIHGSDSSSAIERLQRLAGEAVRQELQVIPYAAHHELVD